MTAVRIARRNQTICLQDQERHGSVRMAWGASRKDEAERAGFEPATQLSPGTRFPVALLRPTRTPLRDRRHRTAGFGGLRRRYKPGNEEGVCNAATWSEKGHEARPPVRAHQGQRKRARRLHRPRRGDRRANGEQGASPLRRVAHRLSELDPRHLVESPRRPAFARQPHDRADEGAALQPGEAAEHQRPFPDEQAPAPRSGESQEVLAANFRDYPETHPLPVSRLASAGQPRLPRLRSGRVPARVAAGLRRPNRADRHDRGPGTWGGRGRREAPLARSRRTDASPLARDKRGALLLDVLLLVRHALLSG